MCTVTPWTVRPQKRSPRTVQNRIISPPRLNIAAIPGPLCVKMKLSNPLEAVMACTFDSMDSSDKDQLLMEPNSEDRKDDNDQEAEVALPISISPRRLIQPAAPRMTSVNGLGMSIMRDWPPIVTSRSASSLHS